MILFSHSSNDAISNGSNDKVTRLIRKMKNIYRSIPPPKKKIGYEQFMT